MLNASDRMSSVAPGEREAGLESMTSSLLNLGALLSAGKIGKEEAAQLVKRAKRTVGTTGQYVGAPPGVDSPQALAAMTRQYLKNVEEGAPGADWYGKSSKAIWDLAGHDPAIADPFVSGVSATSSSTAVPTNFGFAVKGHNQATAGVPVETGRFPASMSPKIEQAYKDPSLYYLGHKQEPFMQQLSQEWAPGRVGRGVNDMWEARSMGYPVDAPSATQHAFMDEVRTNAIKIANREKLAGRDDWSTGSTQAANWVAQKSKAEGISIQQAAQDFADMIESRTALMSRESMPGKGAKHRQDLASASPEDAQAYHDAQNAILLDSLGRDKVMANLGMLTGKTTDTPGWWQGVSNPSTQAPYLVGLNKGGAGFDEGTQKLTDAAAMFHALMTGQDAVAGHFVKPGTMRDATAAAFDIGRPVTRSEMKTLGELLDMGGKGSPIGTGRGINVLGDSAGFGPSMKSFSGDIENATGVKPKTAFGTYGDTGTYQAPNWEGEGLSPATTSALPALTSTKKIEASMDSAKMREIAGKLAELDAASSGPVNEKLQLLRRAFSEGGIAKVKELASKGLLPAALLSAVGLGSLTQGEEDGGRQ